MVFFEVFVVLLSTDAGFVLLSETGLFSGLLQANKHNNATNPIVEKNF
jgi:hypothetical protein